ncbi:unnamed protein product [Caenorhabditis brenneri]
MYPNLSQLANPDIINDCNYNYLESTDSMPPQPDPKLSLYTIVTSIIFLPIAIFFISVGSYSIDLCPMTPHLPIWMISLGSFMLIDRAIAWILELNMYCFKKENSKPDREMKVLIKWEGKKAGHRLRISKYYTITIAGLIFFAISGAYYLRKSMESGQCNALLLYSSMVFCALILLSGVFVLFFSFVIWIYLLAIRCCCS